MIVFAGKLVEKTLTKNGKPLPSDEAKKEQVKVDRAAAEAAHLTPDQVRERLDKRDKEIAKGNEWMAELRDAFNFTLIGEQQYNGGPVYAIKAEPKSNFNGKNAKLFRSAEGSFTFPRTLIGSSG